MSEYKFTPEQEARKQAWLKELSEFIVRANRNAWAADQGQIDPLLPGDKTHEYKEGDWWLLDNFSAYFRAPGITVVRYKERPAWHMYYGGLGMTQSHYDKVKETFVFLREALMQVTTEMPLRGPSKYRNGNRLYTFRMNGNIENCEWVEKVIQDNDLVFTQTGAAGIYIHKTDDRKPLYPWNFQSPTPGVES